MDQVKEKALELISLHIGDMTAHMYQELYKKKKPTFILQSVHSLLSDLLGPKKAQQEFERVKLNTIIHE